ncbi:uncharacterized protein LOC134230930, partial [Saccostrea cucullata]|uniref:uncharacterized protein LOC134230930 n=1 Tax=Saccostrea cuccullata TaxID=36930 RepID=UPI002ED10108
MVADGCNVRNSPKEVQGMIEEQRSIHQEDRYYLRIKTDQDQEHPVSGDPDERLFVDEDLFIGNYGKSGDGVNKLLYVYQTAWQRQLLNRYGNEICLLDATYRTTRYTLPLYFLCVPTNVNYMTVATFIVETEDSVSIQEALSIIKSWNPNWKPAYFMCDYADEEISSIESSFVYLCDFHREQAWERWLKATHNGIGDDKDEILSLLRSVARSKTNEEFELSNNRLK